MILAIGKIIFATKTNDLVADDLWGSVITDKDILQHDST